MTRPDVPSRDTDRGSVEPDAPVGLEGPDELDDLGIWAGPPRGCHRPKAEDCPEEEALPPDGPAGVTPAVPAEPRDPES
ncbi:hypothetical protein [Streptomyces sp. AN091965]|uniref:hypothetical protein n=1 Tax=Streptomyces sp. AN091965 TaxID=2927803 RepID=UPI001F603387|nr:hypothetical protein [Streptomyces sp. AN091965]MCI3934455.1 hypothetical protein [Streptomyces sp. AN091965]